MQTFGDFLRQKRIEKNYTQKDLADKLFVTVSAVSKWEKNVAKPDIGLLTALAEMLSVTEHELITASVDEDTRRKSKDAHKWRTLSFGWNLFFYVAYGIALLTCFIVNLAVDGALTWFWIVFTSLMLSASFTTFPQFIPSPRLVLVPLSEFIALALLLATCAITTEGTWFWLATVPTLFGLVVIFLPIALAYYHVPNFFKRHCAVLCTLVDYALLLATLLVIQNETDGTWFLSIGLPFASLGFAFALAFAIALAYTKCNGFLKTGIALALTTVTYLTCGFVTEPILTCAGVDVSDSTPFAPFSVNFALWSGDFINNNVTFIVFLSLTLLALVFLIVGTILAKKRK